MSWIRGALFALIVAAAIAFVAGFIQFAHVVRAAPRDPPRADAIVALTGTAERLRAGVRLLREGRARRMFISGVNRDVRNVELYAALDIDEKLAKRVDIGRSAEDTLGNASETAAWARERGYDEIILVTDDYHMPRSVTELRLALPEAELYAYPVRTRWTEPGRWNRDPGTFSRLGAEYVKYLLIRMREGVVGASAKAESARAAGAAHA
jgi:uncharacterized SAM-binding protein YcdF (DUF218 family)